MEPQFWRTVCRCYQSEIDPCRKLLSDSGIASKYNIVDAFWPGPNDLIVYIIRVKTQDYATAKKILFGEEA